MQHNYRKLTFPSNNIHRGMGGLPWRCSESAMYANYNLPNIHIVIRRRLLQFIHSLFIRESFIPCTIKQSGLLELNYETHRLFFIYFPVLQVIA